MKRNQLIKVILLSIFLCFLIVPTLFALPFSQDDNGKKPLKIAIKDIKPFIYEDNEGKKVGFSIDLWQAIAIESGLSYEFVEVESVTDQIDAVVNGEVDAAIAAISMTPEREEIIDFSYPYFNAGLQIMTQRESFLSLGSIFAVLFSSEVILAMVGLVLVVVIFGHLVWLLERGHNPDFQHGYFRGVWEGVWWSAVTVTTVGYGDRTPTAFLGRLLALIWMFSGLFIIANFTATITAQLTLNELNSEINDVSDLRGKKLATVEGSTSAEFLRENSLSFLGVGAIEDAYDLLADDNIDAVIYDSPVLLYYVANQDRSHDFEVISEVFNKETYGIGLPHNSPYENEINKALLAIYEDGTYDAIYDKWFVVDE